MKPFNLFQSILHKLLQQTERDRREGVREFILTVPACLWRFWQVHWQTLDLT